MKSIKLMMKQVLLEHDDVLCRTVVMMHVIVLPIKRGQSSSDLKSSSKLDRKPMK